LQLATFTATNKGIYSVIYQSYFHQHSSNGQLLLVSL